VPDEQGERQFTIGGPRAPDYLRPIYANVVNVNHTPWDFRLAFALVRSPLPGAEAAAVETVGEITPEVVADIMIPANLMAGFMTALKQNFDRYLESYGVPGMEPGGPRHPGEEDQA